MSAATVAGLLLIAVPLAFNAAFAALGARFDYPDVLRRPTREVLATFRAGGTSLAFNRYLGVAVGEHLGYLLTGAWTTLAGVALLGSHAALGVVGIVIGPALMLCSLEFVGRSQGWRLAERLTPPAYLAWSLWLIATGIAFL